MIVGLTGGIGSGKSTVAKMFEDLGVPVYVADTEAKKLLENSEVVKKAVIELLGPEAFVDSKPDRVFIASLVFRDSNKLNALNKIIHPQVKIHFKNWYDSQEAPYVIKEAAILFESGSHEDCDFVITVTAPEDIRIKRVMARDQVNEDDVRDRMKNQWEDVKKIELSDFVIHNSSLQDTRDQVRKIHLQLLKKKS
ncbi:dephospho-CoA kinase [Flavobacteriaceae bacterium M23B6Z8]